MNKETVIAAIIISAFLFSLMAVTYPIGEVKANPFWIFNTIEPIPGTIPPNITILSPQNNTVYSSDEITVRFDVNRPQLDTCKSDIIDVKYTLDGETVQAFSIWRGGSASNSWAIPEFSTTFTPPSLPPGNHTLTVAAEGVVYTGGMSIFFISSFSAASFTISTQSSQPIPTPIFNYIYPIPGTLPPNITIISPKNNTASYTDQINIGFNVNRPQLDTCNAAIIDVKYTLDGEAVQAFSIWRGNSASYSYAIPEFSITFTSPSLPSGNHNLTVAAQGIVYAGGSDVFLINSSSTISFATETFPTPNSTPTPTPNPSPSPPSYPTQTPPPSPSFLPSPSPTTSNPPTQQPTPEPTQTPIPTPSFEKGHGGLDYTTTIIILSLTALAVVSGSIVYFKKRK